MAGLPSDSAIRQAALENARRLRAQLREQADDLVRKQPGAVSGAALLAAIEAAQAVIDCLESPPANEPTGASQ